MKNRSRMWLIMLTVLVTISMSIPVNALGGDISVTSTPSSAIIYLDGSYKGKTPFMITGVPSGPHTIKLTLNEYDDWSNNVNVVEGNTATISATLLKTAISVSSTPSNALIYLDGSYKGKTPFTINRVSPGSHTIKLTLNEYDDWSNNVNVVEGNTATVSVTLTKNSPTSSPPGPTSTEIPPTTPLDTSPPAISLLNPVIIEYNNNELLEEGEKVKITYGANDPSGVASIKILIDGTMLESRNQAGTYTVTTNSLSMGKHTIMVEATDSKSNFASEELLLTVERIGPSVYFGTTRNTIKKGEDAIFTLSAVNPIGNPPMTVQLVLKPPSGISVTSSSFAKSGNGQYSTTEVIGSGDSMQSIEIRLTGNQIGAHDIESEVYYLFEGNPKSPTRYETLALNIEAKQISTNFESKQNLENETPGFVTVVTVIGLLLAYVKRKV